MKKQRLGQIYLVVTVILAIVFSGIVIEWFEIYDHLLNKIAFMLLSQFNWLPQTLTHNIIMAFGFALLGFILVLPPSFLGVKRVWIVVGLLLFTLNVFWWYAVEQEVAKVTGHSFKRAFNASVLYTYLADAIGAFVGAYTGETLVTYISSASDQQD